MGRYIGGGLLEREPTIRDLVMVGLKMVDYDVSDEGTEAEIEKKVRTAIDAGILKPLDDDSELDRRTAEINDRVYNDPQFSKAVDDLLEAEDAKRAVQPQQATEQEAEQPKDPPKQDPPKAKDPPKLQPRSIQQRFPDVLDAGNDLELPPPRAWLLGNVFCREFLSSLFGDGGIGKLHCDMRNICRSQQVAH